MTPPIVMHKMTTVLQNMPFPRAVPATLLYVEIQNFAPPPQGINWQQYRIICVVATSCQVYIDNTIAEHAWLVNDTTHCHA